MPRYFFNIEGDGYPDSDEEGTLLDGAEAARSEAVVLAGELLQETDGKFWNEPEWRLHVTDEQGSSVCALTIKGSSVSGEGDKT